MNDRKVRFSAVVALMITLIISGPLATLATSTVVVKPSNMDGWNFQIGHLLSGTSTATGGFEIGPSTSPLPAGSVHFTTGLDGNSFAQIRNRDYNGVLLSGLTALGYDTYVSAHHGCVAPYIVLSVDVNGIAFLIPTQASMISYSSSRAIRQGSMSQHLRPVRLSPFRTAPSTSLKTARRQPL